MRRFRSRDSREASEVPAIAETDATLVTWAMIDPSAFSHVFDRYWDPVFRFCFYRTGDWHDAEDAASQVFVNALRGLSTYRGGEREGAFRSWLFAIAHNVVVNAGEKKTCAGPSRSMPLVNWRRGCQVRKRK